MLKMNTKFDLTQFEDNSPSTTCTVSVLKVTVTFYARSFLIDIALNTSTKTVTA